jgi:hypothetical protein
MLRLQTIVRRVGSGTSRNYRRMEKQRIDPLTECECAGPKRPGAIRTRTSAARAIIAPRMKRPSDSWTLKIRPLMSLGAHCDQQCAHQQRQRLQTR